MKNEKWKTGSAKWKWFAEVRRGRVDTDIEVHVEVPVEFAWRHRLPVEFDVHVPADGALRAEIEQHVPREESGVFMHDLFSEDAGVFVGRAGMVVIATSRGFLVREMAPTVK